MMRLRPPRQRLPVVSPETPPIHRPILQTKSRCQNQNLNRHQNPNKNRKRYPKIRHGRESEPSTQPEGIDDSLPISENPLFEAGYARITKNGTVVTIEKDRDSEKLVEINKGDFVYVSDRPAAGKGDKDRLLIWFAAGDQIYAGWISANQASPLGEMDTEKLIENSREIPECSYLPDRGDEIPLPLLEVEIQPARSLEQAQSTLNSAEPGAVDEINGKDVVSRIKAKKIAFNPSSLKIEKGKSSQLVVVFAPENTTNKALSWKTSNKKVATVDANGLLTAVDTGKAIITATTKDGSKQSAILSVNVVILTQALSISGAASVISGSKVTISARFVPINVSSKSLEWSSSNPNAATVDSKGVVTAKSVAQMTDVMISAMTKDGTNLTAEHRLTVLPRAAGVSILLDNQPASNAVIDLAVSKTMQLSASLAPPDASQLVNWSTSDKKVAKVDATGMVTGLKTGKATITATAKDGSGKKAFCKIEVTVLAKTISISGPGELTSGNKAMLKAEISPSDAVNKSVIWTNSNPSIATVDSNGIVMAKNVTKATDVNISATTKDGTSLKAEHVLTIRPKVNGISILLNGQQAAIAVMDMPVSNTMQLSASVTPSDALQSITWCSSDKRIATVSTDGLVAGLKAGTVTITATTKDGSGKKAACKVTVTVLAKSVGIGGVNELPSGGKATLSASVLPSSTSNKAVAWSSSNPNVATVDSAGVVTAKIVAEATAVTISAATKDGTNLKADHTLTVRPRVDSVTILAGGQQIGAATLYLADQKTLQLAADVHPSDAVQSVVWSTSDKMIANVNSNGLVTGFKSGSATIAAATRDGSGKKDAVKVTVKAGAAPTTPPVVPTDNTAVVELSETTAYLEGEASHIFSPFSEDVYDCFSSEDEISEDCFTLKWISGNAADLLYQEVDGHMPAIYYANIRSTGTVIYDLIFEYGDDIWVQRLTLTITGAPDFDVSMDSIEIAWPKGVANLLVPFPSVTNASIEDDLDYALILPDPLEECVTKEYAHDGIWLLSGETLPAGRYLCVYKVWLHNYVKTVDFTLVIDEGSGTKVVETTTRSVYLEGTAAGLFSYLDGRLWDYDVGEDLGDYVSLEKISGSGAELFIGDEKGNSCVMYRNLSTIGEVVYDITFECAEVTLTDRLTLTVMNFPYRNFRAELSESEYEWASFDEELYVPYPELTSDNEISDEFKYDLILPKAMSEDYDLDRSVDDDGFCLDYSGNALEEGEYECAVEASLLNFTVSVPFTIVIGEKRPPLAILSFSADAPSAYVDNPISWTVAATGGVAPVVYEYTLLRDGTRVGNAVRSYSGKYRYFAADEGSYVLRVSATDAKGAMDISESSPVAVTHKALSIDEILKTGGAYAGDTITWTVAADGGILPYSYEYELTIDGAAKAGVRRASGAYSTFTESAGTYVLHVTVTDASGAADSMESTAVVEAARPLELLGVRMDRRKYAVNRDTAAWTAVTSGGTAPYSYEATLSLDGEAVQNWPASENDVFEYIPAKPGMAVLAVTVTDALGAEESRMSEPVAFSGVSLEIAKVSCESSVGYVGQPIRWSAEYSGGTGAVMVDYAIYCNGTLVRTIPGGGACEYTPETAGSYIVQVTARDEAQNTATLAGGAVTVHAPLAVDRLEASASAVVVGDEITWTATASGGAGGLSYTFSVLRGEEIVYASKSIANGVLKYKPAAPGSYHVAVTAKDTLGGTVEKTGGIVSVSERQIDWTMAAESDFTFRTLSGGGAEITGYIGEGGSIIIPERLGGRSVTSIGYRSFYKCEHLYGIKLSEGVQSIGGSAFDGCTNLMSIDIPDGVNNIGGDAFYGCSSLVNIDLPDKVPSIGNYAFAYCANLTVIDLPDSLSSIGESAFRGCIGLTAIDLPDTVTSIGSYAFDGCTNLMSIKMPDGPTSLGYYSVFRGCSSLASIRVPDGTEYIGDSAFYGCTSLVSIDLSDGIERIGDSAFYGCTSLLSIDIPDGITSIASFAFRSCSRLTSISFPDSVTSIGYAAFDGCISLRRVDLSEKVTSIGGSAFYNCTNLVTVNIPSKISSIEGYTFRYCVNLKDINLPNGVTNIGYAAFDGCSELTSINLSNSLISIGYDAFRGCGNLVSIDIPDSVTSIDRSAFSGCVRLSRVKLPANVVSIKEFTFNDCKCLEDIYIPEGVTKIDGFVFSDCISLTNIYIPNSVTSIGGYAFLRCNWDKLTLYGKAGSYAQTFASAQGITFSTSPMPGTLEEAAIAILFPDAGSVNEPGDLKLIWSKFPGAKHYRGRAAGHDGESRRRRHRRSSGQRGEVL